MMMNNALITPANLSVMPGLVPGIHGADGATAVGHGIVPISRAMNPSEFRTGRGGGKPRAMDARNKSGHDDMGVSRVGL